jgi:hypothetical protein
MHEMIESPRTTARVLRCALLVLACAAALPAHAGAQATDVDPCAREPDAFACTRSREWRTVETWSHLVRREGGGLSLQLDGGRRLTLTDVPASHGPEAGKPVEQRETTYALRAYLPRINAYVVALAFRDGGAFVLVEARSGRQMPLNGEPRFSPDGARFVEASQADRTGVVPSQISVWRMAEGGPVREFQAKPAPGEAWDPVEPVWTSSSTIRFVRRSSDRSGFSLRESAVLLRLGPAGWEMRAAR